MPTNIAIPPSGIAFFTTPHDHWSSRVSALSSSDGFQASGGYLRGRGCPRSDSSDRACSRQARVTNCGPPFETHPRVRVLDPLLLPSRENLCRRGDRHGCTTERERLTLTGLELTIALQLERTATPKPYSFAQKRRSSHPYSAQKAFSLRVHAHANTLP